MRVCPTPDKKAHPTRGQAVACIRRFWRTNRHPGPMPVRAYRCRCGMWHITHEPKRE